MARNWYVRTGGADANGGTTDSNTADFSGSNGVVVTATLTEVGAFASVPDPGVINLQDGGVSVIRTYVKVNNDSITLDSAPPGGDATYAWKIGGARASIKKMVMTGSGQNAKVATGDTVFVQTGTYTENAITPIASLFLRASGGMVTVDGTGGAGGSDVFTALPGVTSFDGFIAANAVDDGFVWASQGQSFVRCGAQSCGGDGWDQPHAANTAVNMILCYARACTGSGFRNTSGLISLHAFCEAGDNGASGFVLGVAASQALGCLAYDNVADGFHSITAHINNGGLVNCTAEGNGSDGWEADAAPLTSAVFINNLFTNNTTTGAKGFGTNTAVADYNLFFGNGTDRSNFPTGTNDKSTDPKYTAAASDDYSIKSTGGAYKAGYSPFKNPTLNTLNIGAVPGPGSTQLVDPTAASGGIPKLFGF